MSHRCGGGVTAGALALVEAVPQGWGASLGKRGWGQFPRSLLCGARGEVPVRARKGADGCLTRIDFRGAGMN